MVSLHLQGKKVLLLISQLVPLLKCERYRLTACLVGPAEHIHINWGKSSCTQALTSLFIFLDSMNIVYIDPRDRGVTKCKAIVPVKKGPVVNCIGGSGRPLFESRGT